MTMMPDPFAQNGNAPALNVAPINLPAAKPRGGMFGGGGALRGIAGMIGDYLLQRNGMQPVYTPAMMRHQEMQREDQQYQQRRGDQFEDWRKQQEFKLTHQPEDDLAQMMRAAGVDPNSPQGQQFYTQALQNKVNPFVQMRVQNPDGSESLQFTRPPAIPTAPVGGLTPIDDGGPAAPPPATFPFGR